MKNRQEAIAKLEDMVKETHGNAASAGKKAASLARSAQRESLECRKTLWKVQEAETQAIEEVKQIEVGLSIQLTRRCCLSAF